MGAAFVTWVLPAVAGRGALDSPLRAYRGPDVRRAMPSPDPTAATAELLTRARDGDEAALNALYERLVPPLRRWARGRLPTYARDLAETQDLVQDTVLHSLRHLGHFDDRHQGALQAYLRQAVLNRIRDEIRRHHRRPRLSELDPSHPDDGVSPLEQAIGQERLERYESALQRLRPIDREAIIARLELQYDYREVAEALGKSSPDAARVAVTRAIARLVAEMTREG
jgi:RNA polymerase sigma-70 factor, ECF subfamily